MNANERFYDSQYTSFATGLQAAIRREAFGEDLGQNGWLDVEEYHRFFGWLEAGAGRHVLDVACGSGGPSLYMAATTGCRVTGIDVNASAIRVACELSRAQGLEERAGFQTIDASRSLPFPDASFDALVCVDAINHLPDRPRVLAEWARVLVAGGRIVFTDPIVVTGILTHAEIAMRSSIGVFLYAAPGEDERLLREAGFTIVHVEDSTDRVATNALGWHDARARHRDALIAEEGDEAFAAKQSFLHLAGKLAEQRRLSRFTYVATAPQPQ